MRGQIIFYRSLDNHDSKPTIELVKELNCNHLAILVQGGDTGYQGYNYKTVAGIKTDKWLDNYFREAGDVKIWLYHDMAGSDPAKEASTLIKRIANYVNHSAFGGIITVVDANFNKRTTSAIALYCAELEEAYPGIKHGWLNLASNLNSSLIDTWMLHTSFDMFLVTDWNECRLGYLRTGANNSSFIPVYPICDIAGRKYKFTSTAAKSFWSVMNAQDMQAVGMWNATPYDGAIGIHTDGPSAYMQTAKTLKFTPKDLPVTPQPEPEPEPELPPVSEEKMIEGIDTSHWESDIYWDRVLAAGKKFVSCKATEYILDPDYKKDIQAAKAAGLLVGSYHFFRCSRDTLQQAKVFLNAIKGMPMDLPPVLDVEEDKIGYGWRNYQTALKLFLDTVEGETGRKPMIYTSAYYWSFTNYPSWAKDYPLWVANYGVNSPAIPKSWDKWTFWQYSEAGKIDGIPYDGVDLDRFNGSYEDLLAFCKIVPVELPPVPPATEDRLPAFLTELDALRAKYK